MQTKAGNFQETCRHLAVADFIGIAEVNTLDGAVDLAVAVTPHRLAVIRSVDRCTRDDHADVATMVCQGDFIWGAIVYSESVEPDLVGLIPRFHVSELDRLVSHLQELQEACRGSD